jgi:hypothetical protein
MDITRNPTRSDIGRMLKQHSTVRAIRDPESGQLYAWRADLGLHVDAAHFLNLPFKTRRELQANSHILHDLEDFDDLAVRGTIEE